MENDIPVSCNEGDSLCGNDTQVNMLMDSEENFEAIKLLAVTALFKVIVPQMIASEMKNGYFEEYYDDKDEDDYFARAVRAPFRMIKGRGAQRRNGTQIIDSQKADDYEEEEEDECESWGWLACGWVSVSQTMNFGWSFFLVLMFLYLWQGWAG